MRTNGFSVNPMAIFCTLQVDREGLMFGWATKKEQCMNCETRAKKETATLRGMLEPLAEAIAKRVKAGTSLFADDTPLKLLAPGNRKTKTARIWAYVRDERPWSGQSCLGFS